MIRVAIRHSSVPGDFSIPLAVNQTVGHAREALFRNLEGQENPLDVRTCRLFLRGREVTDDTCLEELVTLDSEGGEPSVIFVAAPRSSTSGVRHRSAPTQSRPQSFAPQMRQGDRSSDRTPEFGAPVGNSGPSFASWVSFGSVFGCLLVIAWSWLLGVLSFLTDVYAVPSVRVAPENNYAGETVMLIFLTVVWVFTALLPWMNEPTPSPS